MKKFIALAGFIFLLKISFAQCPSFVTDCLDLYIKEGMTDWKVPALSIVIVKDGKVVFLKGYGVKDINSKDAVDENTLFMIASNTKLFTGTALAQLEYDKKLSLDDKITKYYPDYKLYEPTTTQLVTIRDLLSHRIGNKTFQGDFTFWNSNLSRQTIMQKMRLLKPSGNFRQQYGYCNSCFMTAGQVIPKVTGKEWQAYVKDSFFIPIGMNNTYASINDAPKDKMAKPYTTSYTGTLRDVPYDKWDNLGPAASIISSASDLAKWLMFQLDSGKVNGKQVVPFEVLQKTRDINITVNSRRSASTPTHMAGYGLGLFVQDYNGRQVYWHTGGAAGMLSVVCFVPEERLGFAVLSSNDNQNLFSILRTQLLDAYLGVPYKNRSKAALNGFNDEMKKSLKEISDWKERAKRETVPPLPLSSYAGTYNNPIYGSITISVRDKGLMIKFNSHEDLSATLDYMDDGEWLMQYNNIEYGIFSVKFNINKNKVVSIETKQNEFVEIDPYVFVKQ